MTIGAKSVLYEKISSEIALLRLNEPESGNTFTTGIIEGIQRYTDRVAEDNLIKVVILTGTKNHFCCGGTKRELEDICCGRLSFSDLSFYRTLLDLDVMTISAMQGHALGGGLVMGLYADVVVLANESIYSANFMNYGFTPGMGATYMLPKKLGYALGSELLYTGNNYYGRQLAHRGAGVLVVDRNDVVQKATELARDLADKPRVSLQLLKAALTSDIKRELESVVQWELAMHDVSFRQDVVRERINAMGGRF